MQILNWHPSTTESGTLAVGSANLSFNKGFWYLSSLWSNAIEHLAIPTIIWRERKNGHNNLGICLNAENRENVFNLREAKLHSYLARGKRLLEFFAVSSNLPWPHIFWPWDKGQLPNKRSRKGRALSGHRWNRQKRSWTPLSRPPAPALRLTLSGTIIMPLLGRFGTLANCYISKALWLIEECSKILKPLFKNMLF